MDRRAGRAAVWGWLAGAAALAVVAAIVVVIAASGDEDEETLALPEDGRASAAPEAEETLSQVADSSGELFGERVTVAGEVNRIIVAPGAFTVAEVGGDAAVVVPRAGTLLPPVRRGDTIVATGTVHPLGAPGLEDEIDRELRIDFDTPPFDPFRDLALVLASDVEEAAERASPDPTPTIDNLIARASQYVREPVTGRGEVSAARIPGPGFVLGGEAQAERIPVLPAAGTELGDPGEDTIVSVFGTLRAFGEAGLADELADGVELEADVFNAFRDGPLLVATRIEPVGEAG